MEKWRKTRRLGTWLKGAADEVDVVKRSAGKGGTARAYGWFVPRRPVRPSLRFAPFVILFFLSFLLLNFLCLLLMAEGLFPFVSSWSFGCLMSAFGHGIGKNDIKHPLVHKSL